MEENNQVRVAADRTSTFALIAGVVSIPMSIAIIPGVLIGILAITLGIISRINSERFNLNNILGIVFGGIGIFLSAVVFIGTLLMLQNPETLNQLTDIMQSYPMY